MGQVMRYGAQMTTATMKITRKGQVTIPAEFILPYRGGGASFWPIALFFGGIYGAIAGGLGVMIASFFMKDKKGFLKWLANWFRKHSVLGDDERLR